MMTSQSSLIEHMGSMATAFNALSQRVSGGFAAGSPAGARHAPAEAPSVAHLDEVTRRAVQMEMEVRARSPRLRSAS